MITKEELEKLIKEEATIYEADGEKINQIKLTSRIEISNDMIIISPTKEKNYIHHKYFNRLYKTKDEAEFALKFKNKTRTETLDLPTWEELQDKVKDLEDHHDYIIVFNSRFVMEYEKTFIDQIYLNQNQPPYERYNWNGNKEGYIEACEMALNLFLDKEQPKELTKRIAELEEENAKLKEQLKWLGNIQNIKNALDVNLLKVRDYCETQYNRFENTPHKTGYSNEDISNAYFDVQNFVEDIIKEIDDDKNEDKIKEELMKKAKKQ